MIPVTLPPAAIAAMKWCNGPCGRMLQAAEFYKVRRWLSAYCKRCNNIRRTDAFRQRYSTPTGRANYLRAQRRRRHARSAA